MGCENCSQSGGIPRGCKNNGTCSSGGCNKLGVFNWLSNMSLASGQNEYDIMEIRFKNGRKLFYRNTLNLTLQVGDTVVTEAAPGHDVGIVSIVGELNRIQVNKKSPDFKPHEARKILRKATQEDIDLWIDSQELEKEVMLQARKIANSLHLEMKISDVEFQGDKTKATFYYIADGRVDFRQLIKDLAGHFKVRIEMRQIGARQEAARIGGIGPCGRELCCSTWLTDFRSVSTSAARYQQLSLNPQKLAGLCGKLKCCLNFELDMYLDAVKELPSPNTKLKTAKGNAYHVKTDVFKKTMWFAYEKQEGPETNGIFPLSAERVREIIAANKKGETALDLIDFEEKEEKEKKPDYFSVVGQDSLNRFDDKFKKKKNKKRNPNKNSSQKQAQHQNQTQNKVKNKPKQKKTELVLKKKGQDNPPK